MEAWQNLAQQMGVRAHTKAGVKAFAPLMAFAFAGIESRKEPFRHVSVVDEILDASTPVNPSPIGINPFYTTAFGVASLYQAVHGALCLHTHQVALAVSLARHRILSRNQMQSLYQVHETFIYVGEMRGPEAEKMRLDALDDLPWLLTSVFGSPDGYCAALYAYYAAIHIAELADLIGAAKGGTLNLADHTTVCLWEWASPKEPIRRRAIDLLLKNKEEMRQIWRSRGIDDTVIRMQWSAWISSQRAHRDNLVSNGRPALLHHMWQPFHKDLLDQLV